jgi:hypothetical protein
MNKLLNEGIVNALFQVSGLDFETHYKRFYKQGKLAIEDEYSQFKHRFLESLMQEFSRGVRIYDKRLESIQKSVKKDLTHKEQMVYCDGYNACAEEHKHKMDILSDIVVHSVEYALERH